MILLQFSAGQGPAECCLAVTQALTRLQFEAQKLRVDISELELEVGPRSGTLRSALVALTGEEEEVLAARWCGTLQWNCASPYRPHHGRKNWFIGVERIAQVQQDCTDEIAFTTLRSSGPGGQHVNKTESAIRATHLASGISVRVQSERSQHANKRLAIALIARQLQQRAQRQQGDMRAQRRILHHRLTRGAAVRVFVGERFEPQR